MTITVTPIYAAILTALYLVLSFRVIGRRRASNVALGDGGDRALFRRQRVHANFAEYVPLALVLMVLAELQGLPHWALHAIGILIVAGRVAHAYGVSQEAETLQIRGFAMALTFTSLIAAAVSNVVMLLIR